MNIFFQLRARTVALILGLAFVAVVPTESAWAIKNSTIILRATGSGAGLGLLAGIASYPFAKSSGTVVAGAMVGAVLGAVYGFYLVDRRDAMYRQATALGNPGSVELDQLYARNDARDEILRRGKRHVSEFTIPIPIYQFEF